jgi:hypothetical protein
VKTSSPRYNNLSFAHMYSLVMIREMQEYLGGSLCPSGDAVTNLTRDVYQYLPYQIQTIFQSNATCAAVEEFIKINCSPTDDKCSWSELIAAFCGCPLPYAANETCVFCPDVPLPNPYYAIQSLRYFGYPPTSCHDLSLLTTQLHAGSARCQGFSGLAGYCGCSTDLRVEFFSTTDKGRKKFLVWLPRLSGVLSLIGSAYIIRDIASTQRRNGIRMNVYFELMLCMSIFDICSSAAWMFSSLPVPTINKYSERTAVYGAKGTEATCTLQGFFVQLGFTGIFYNLALSFYYLLMIRYGWREDKLRKALPYFRLALVVGVGLGKYFVQL